MTVAEEQIRKQINENIAMQAYLHQFNQAEVNGFMSFYVHKKYMWLNHAERYIGQEDEDALQWVSQATRHLEIIQQKKLFDLQCRWRAEKINIPDVRTTADFIAWEYNILNCPFLEPVTTDDIELYAQYLLLENPDTSNSIYAGYEQWQEYDEIIEAYKTNNENRNFPEWYDFYNGRRGTGVYMLLPDIRGEKETVYTSLALEQEKIESNYTPTSPDTRKSLPYTENDHFNWFVKTFETKQVQELYTAWQWHTRTSDIEEEMQYYIDILMEADEPIPMPANYSWQEAIKQAANSFVNKKTAEALPEALEQYLMKLQMNITLTNQEDKMYSTLLWIKDLNEGRILKGRKLSGEPEDFNF